MKRSKGPERAHLVIATGVVAAAALAGAWAPANLIGILALFALIRICWLEDNISNDLVGKDRLPGDYVNTAIRRGNFLRRWFAMEPAEDASQLPPHKLATAMRAEIQVWACALLGMSATMVAKAGVLGQPGSLVLGAVLFVMALRRIDRLLVSLAHCAAGEALPQNLLLPTHRRAVQEDE
jgi:hypothetical protein